MRNNPFYLVQRSKILMNKNCFDNPSNEKVRALLIAKLSSGYAALTILINFNQRSVKKNNDLIFNKVTCASTTFLIFF
ncbi:MAG: hypothetical protein Kow0029_10630 [Candidatus Rifleibacteriota bacterium]